MRTNDFEPWRRLDYASSLACVVSHHFHTNRSNIQKIFLVNFGQLDAEWRILTIFMLVMVAQNVVNGKCKIRVSNPVSNTFPYRDHNLLVTDLQMLMVHQAKNCHQLFYLDKVWPNLTRRTEFLIRRPGFGNQNALSRLDPKFWSNLIYA